MKIAKYLSEMDLLNAECKLAEVKKVNQKILFMLSGC